MRKSLLNLILVFFVLIINNYGAYAMKLTSTAFNDGDILPSVYTCDGRGISPPLSWSDIPTKTKSFALIYDDPDAPAGTWTHWLLYNLPPEINFLAENITALPRGTKVGTNSSPQIRYGAPCPPYGEHRYIFHLYALDSMFALSGTVTSDVLQHAMNGHILEVATLMGRYTRTKK
jgi:Raf kinase inhibitor-like YbhB/YbcL family protein